MAYQSVPVRGCERGVCATLEIEDSTGRPVGVTEIIVGDGVKCPLGKKSPQELSHFIQIEGLNQASCLMKGCKKHVINNSQSDAGQTVYSETGTLIGRF